MKNLFNTFGIILTIFIISSCKEKPVPPVLSTASVSAITTTSAVSGGNVTDDGGASVISRGVCWNTSENPVITNNKTSDSEGSGSFTSNLTQLTPNTSYFVRAYATNSAGTSYGSSVSFKTTGDKPASTASNATEILTTSAILNGTVNPNSLTTSVTFEYGLTTNYGNTSAASQSSLSGDSNGNVTAALTGLNPGKIYHYRIKAENSLGITYSSDMTFTTLGQVPTAISQTTTNLQIRTATLNGSVNPNYLSTTVTFEWGTTTSYGNSITPTQSPISGSTAINMSVDLSGLTPETTYHFRIKSENELGTTYSTDIKYTTFSVIDIDNNAYHSILINSQQWLSENLKVTHFQNGDPIPIITSDTEWSNLNIAAYCIYKNEIANTSIYGNIYNFYVAKDSRNVCPVGWHVPSLDEWHTLVTYLGGDSIADEKLREAGTAHWFYDTGASNTTGFTLLPAGNREADGRFFNLHSSTYIWSSFEDYENTVQRCWNIGLEWNTSKIYWTPYSVKYGASIRCLKN